MGAIIHEYFDDVSDDADRLMDEIVHSLKCIKNRVNVDEEAMSMLYEKIGMTAPKYPVPLFSTRFKNLIFDAASMLFDGHGKRT